MLRDVLSSRARKPVFGGDPAIKKTRAAVGRATEHAQYASEYHAIFQIRQKRCVRSGVRRTIWRSKRRCSRFVTSYFALAVIFEEWLIVKNDSRTTRIPWKLVATVLARRPRTEVYSTCTTCRGLPQSVGCIVPYLLLRPSYPHRGARRPTACSSLAVPGRHALTHCSVRRCVIPCSVGAVRDLQLPVRSGNV